MRSYKKLIIRAKRYISLMIFDFEEELSDSKGDDSDLKDDKNRKIIKEKLSLLHDVRRSFEKDTSSLLIDMNKEEKK